MSERPTIHPHVFAAIAEGAPDRLRRKLDQNPTLANEWEWRLESGIWTIDAGNEQVRLETLLNLISQVDQVKCSCLLSPRCLHVLSVLSVLKLAEVDLQESSLLVEAEEAAEEEVPLELNEAQLQAAKSLWETAATILATGARAAGTLLQSHLLRAIHGCRSQGLHRLSAAGLRVIENVRLLREEDDSFRSEDLLADFTEVLRVAWTLTRTKLPPGKEWLGVARREYVPAGSLRLTGLFTEPILTRTGFSGVVTYLLAEDDQLASVSNVRPGSSERIAEAYQTGADLGGLSLPHQSLSRQALLVQKATRSPDGRIGGGKECRAVATDSQGWNSGPVARRFSAPLADQISRVFQAEAVPVAERPAGWDFLFLEGTILGSDGENVFLVLGNDQGLLRLKIALDHPALPFRENLELLTCAPGLQARFIARMLPSAPGDALALAFAPLNSEGSSPGCQFPEKWQGHGNLGIDKLERRFFSSAQRQPQIVASPHQSQGPPDGLDFVRRRLQAVALGGRHALPTGRVGAAVSDARTLDVNLQPAAAALLKGLAQCAIESQTDLLGLRFPPDPSHLAERWLAGAVYEEAARRHFQKWNWQKVEG